MIEHPELLLIDKPAGKTSMDVIRVLRRKLDIKKIGHAGTLDPLATGLMLIGISGGTKKLTELVKLDKEYLAEIRIGEKRTTGDLEGEVIEAKAATTVTKEEVEKALKNMVGNLTLPVSAYSAIKVDGIPMYKRARKAEQGEVPVGEVPVRTMSVYSADPLSYMIVGDWGIVTVRFSVGSGTYVRSLAEELGRRLNYPATLQNLRRTKVGEYDIKNAKRLEDI